jgi:hypothetical protein
MCRSWWLVSWTILHVHCFCLIKDHMTHEIESHIHITPVICLILCNVVYLLYIYAQICCENPRRPQENHQYEDIPSHVNVPLPISISTVLTYDVVVFINYYYYYYNTCHLPKKKWIGKGLVWNN